MLTLQDCLGLCELTEDEIRAIAKHEHIPEIIAAELAEYLVHEPDGTRKIRRIILDDIKDEEDRGHTEKAEKLRMVLAHFIATHPEFTDKAVGA
ncbi:MAG: hypothetical protein P8Y12_01350 [Gammaproteobacteria bacterium]